MSDIEPNQGVRPQSRMRAILGGSAGNLVEWYDWFAYAAFSIYFAKVFFPAGDQTAQFMKTAAVFAVGFLARPVGAWLMGLYADRAGRRAALTLAVALMSLGSLIIAVTPGFDKIGAAAPAILLAARILQGLSVGGEYGASATYMSEMAGRQRRGFWSSFQYVTLIMGQLIAALVLVVLQATLQPEQLSSWGWRIPFFIGAALAVVVFWIRSGLEESQSFVAAQAAAKAAAASGSAPRAGALAMFREHPREALAIIGLTAAGSLAFYAYTTYMLKFLTNTTGFSKEVAGAVNLATLVGFMLIQPLFGWLSDRWGRRRMLVFAFSAGAVLAWPIFTLVARATDPVVAFLLILAALVVQSAYTSISAVVKAELFPAHVRALGVALPYALGNAVFGGSAEYVALWFKSVGMESGFYIYLTVMMAMGAMIALSLRDSAHHSRILED